MCISKSWMILSWIGLVLIAAGAVTQVACTPPGGGTTTGDDPGTVLDSNPGTVTDGAPAISGTLTVAATTSSQRVPNPAGREVEFDTPQGCVVVAVSNATQLIYRADVATDGSFQLDLPESEAGNTLMVTILGPDGKPLGPVLVGTADGNGLTGLKPDGGVDLGTIEIPPNLGDAPLVAGDDANVPTGNVDDGAPVRLDGNGVPVGVNTFGKGTGALANGPVGDGIDADHDGLVDLFDADDDGNGRVDDLEIGAGAWDVPSAEDARPNFFTNLKIEPESADVYYHGTPAEIDAAISAHTVITFEVVREPTAKRSMTGAHLLSSPAPAYLPLTTVTGGSQPWSAGGYAFSPHGDRYDVFVTPNAVMQAGDTFTVEVSFDDGASLQYTRMLNYILKNIPHLVRYGAPGALQDYDPATPPGSGTNSVPVPFDGTQPLALEFNPPVDETGAYLEGFEYQFHLFFYDEFGGQLNGDMDIGATWPTPVAGLDQTQYRVSATDAALATLSADNTYTLEIPTAVLPTTVVMKDASTKTVAKYKIDITAACPSGNSAICLYFAKQ